MLHKGENMVKLLAIKLLLIITYVSGEVNFTISVDNSRYLIFEPIYLEMVCINRSNETNYSSTRISDCNSKYQLEIKHPNGAVGVYAPPIRSFSDPFEKLKIGESVRFETLLMTAGKFITEKDGNYQIWIRNKQTGSIVSNMAAFFVHKPETNDEVKAIGIISRNKLSYAMFTVFEGGDQFLEGKNIYESLSDLALGIGDKGRAITSINESYDYVKMSKLVRKKNKYVHDNLVADRTNLIIPKYLRLRIAETWAQEFKVDEMTEKMKSYITRVSGDIDSVKMSKQFEAVSRFAKK